MAWLPMDVEHTTLDTGDGASMLRLIVGKDVVGEVDGTAAVQGGATPAASLAVVLEVART